MLNFLPHLSSPRASTTTSTFSRAARLVLMIPLVIVGCKRPGTEGGAKDGTHELDSDESKEPVKPVPVFVQPVGRATISARAAAASTIEAEIKADITAESSGRLTKLDVEEGMTLKKGVVVAQVRRDAQSASLVRADVSLEQARREYERLASLMSDGAIGQAEVDAARDRLETAKLDIRDRRRDIANTTVKSPFEGVVTERYVSPGTYVSMGQKLFALADFSTLVARVHLPEKELDHVQVGQEVDIAAKTVAGRRGVGKVSRIAPVVDPATGTFKVTVSLPPELASLEAGFIPGMYAEIVFVTAVHRDVLAIPKSAVLHEAGQEFVFLETDGKAQRRAVKTGLIEGDLIEVLSGVEVGDRLIVVGQQVLRDESPVQVETQIVGEKAGALANEAARHE